MKKDKEIELLKVQWNTEKHSQEKRDVICFLLGLVTGILLVMLV